MTYVVVFAVSLVVASLLWLGLMTFRAFRQVRDLSRRVGAAGARIADAATAIETIVPKERL